MNIYQRLQAVRDALRTLDLKPTGRNDAKDYAFFEMGDFWPQAVELFADHGLFTMVTFGTELAYLCIGLLEDDSAPAITFAARVSTFKGLGSPVQDQGGADSYVKRRLYLNALELIEKDPVDGAKGKPKKPVNVADRFNDVAAEVDPPSDPHREPGHVREGVELPPIVIKRKGGNRGKA